MSTTKKFLKHIREDLSAALPTHPSDASTELPDSLEGKMGARPIKPQLDATKAGLVAKKAAHESTEEEEDMKESAEEDLPTHPSDAAVQIPDKLKEEEDKDHEAKETKAAEKKEDDESKEDEEKMSHMKEEDATISEKEEEELSDEEKKEMKEGVNALVSDENLPEAFKTKVAAIFEAAVKRTAKKRVAAHTKKLVESFNTKLTEGKKEISETLIDKVDGYLDYVVEEWMKENEVAIEGSLRSNITERFIVGLKGLFESHYVEIPAEKADVVSMQEARIAELEKELNEELAKSVEIRKENINLKKDAIVKKHTEGLTVSATAKFKELCEGVSFDGAETFSQKLKVIKETYFPKNPKCSGDLDASLLIEGGIAHEEPAQTSTEVDVYAEAISRMVKR